jgi:hypothetical protein
MRHCLDWETLVCFGCALLPIFVPFLLPHLTRKISFAEWIFSMAYCLLPSVTNWKYAAYRGTSHVPAVDDDTGKEDTAIRCGMTLYGDWRKATGLDWQTNTMTANCQLLYNNLIRGGPEEDLGKWKTTHQILVQTHTKSTLKPSRIWTRWSTVKYRETLDASQKGEFVIICPGTQPNFNFWCYSPWLGYVQWHNMSFSVVCCDNSSYMSTLGELCRLGCRWLKQAQAYTNYIEFLTKSEHIFIAI